MKVGDLRYVHTQPSSLWSAGIVQITQVDPNWPDICRVRVVTGGCTFTVGHPDYHKRDDRGGHILEGDLRKLTKVEHLIVWWKLLWMKSL